jgi:CRP-like cAMP-binding protein
LASFVDTTVKDIDDRLSELRQEVKKLEAARAALVGAGRGPGRPPGSGRGRPTTRRAIGTRRRGRRRGGTRANQALELVRGKPGITIPEIASAMGIEPNYLYRVLPKLASDGQVTRQGQGWHPASA